MAVQRRRPRRWPLPVIGTLVVVLVAAIVTACIPLVTAPSPNRSPVAVAPSEPPGSPGSPAPTAEGSEAPLAGEPGARAYWLMRPEADGTNTLEVGVVGRDVTARVGGVGFAPEPGVIAVIGQQRIVTGPDRGRVVVASRDGAEYVLTAIDAHTGATRELLRSRELIVEFAFADGLLIFLTANGQSGEITGVWQMDIDAADEPRPIDGFLGVHPEIALIAQAEAVIRLMVSPDGQVASVLHCRRQNCVLRSVNLGDGTRLEQPVPFGADLVGVFDHYAVILPICPEPQCCEQMLCEAVRLDMSSGETEPLPPGSWAHFSSLVVQGSDGPVLVAQTGSIDRPAFSATDLEAMVTAQPVAVELGTMSIAPPQGAQFGVESRPGWFTVAGQAGDFDPLRPGQQHGFEVNVATGELIQLIEIPTFFVQG